MKNFFLFLLLSCSTGTYAQQRMIVYFKDKGNAAPVEVSERALARRIKNGVVPDAKDINLAPEYLTALSADGQILNRSRWLNAVTFESSLSKETLLEKYIFIDHINVIQNGSNTVKKNLKFDYTEPKSLNYGVADTQVRQIGADCLHDMGYTGQGVFLALIDAGFRGMDTVSCFDSVYLENRILDMHDFVNNTGVYDYSGHGTAVGSCIFGEKQGTNVYAGTAVDVDIALYVSEDVSSETPIEEFNLVAALERCDSVGVDIASISLGYTIFDDPADNHTYWDMDGQTTTAAQGINTAVSKGIMVCAAAGNEGPSWISTPCDADSSLCVGAVDNQGNYATFSSVGPDSDGQVKPDVMATGQNTWVFLEDGTLVMGNGTSFATPVMAGAVACLIDANPLATVHQLHQVIRQSASQYNSPDGYMGFGIPDLCSANDSLIAMGLGVDEISSASPLIYPNPASDHVFIQGVSLKQYERILIMDLPGNIVYRSEQINGSVSVAHLINGVYFIVLQSKDGSIISEKLLIKH